jgi:hypothetical protein
MLATNTSKLTRCCARILSIFIVVLASGCTTGPLKVEEVYYLAATNGKDTNYYRITVKAGTQLGVAEYRAGMFPASAVDALSLWRRFTGRRRQGLASSRPVKRADRRGPSRGPQRISRDSEESRNYRCSNRKVSCCVGANPIGTFRATVSSAEVRHNSVRSL